MSVSRLYQWSEEELQIPKDRRLELRSDCLDYWKRIRSYLNEDGTLLVLKSVENALFAPTELCNLRLLLAISSNHNHTIPADIVSCAKTSIIIMPYLHLLAEIPWYSLDTLTDVNQQLLQGLEFMHENGIAHFDIHPDNLAICREPPLPTSPLLVQESRCYFIDFGSSKRLPPPPRGSHGDICVPYLPFGGHFEPPEGRERVNPYAYDVYCMGKSAQNMCQTASLYALRSPGKGRVRVPPALWEFCEILSTKDRRMRPTATQSLKLIHIAWRWNKMTQWLYWFAPYQVADGVNLLGWRYIIWLVYSMKQRTRNRQVVHRSQRVQVPYIYRLILFTCSALLHSILPLYMGP
ncbi:hypothetical protein BDW22DRAFT_1354542 [Trametopsis cervina]|nr:hypothetical protein BDW22DRAFT_1354542 [Trametopsis cervina]